MFKTFDHPTLCRSGSPPDPSLPTPLRHPYSRPDPEFFQTCLLATEASCRSCLSTRSSFSSRQAKRAPQYASRRCLPCQSSSYNDSLPLSSFLSLSSTLLPDATPHPRRYTTTTDEHPTKPTLNKNLVGEPSLQPFNAETQSRYYTPEVRKPPLPHTGGPNLPLSVLEHRLGAKATPLWPNLGSRIDAKPRWMRANTQGTPSQLPGISFAPVLI